MFKKLTLILFLFPLIGFSQQTKKYIPIEDYYLVKNELNNTKKIIISKDKQINVYARYEITMVKHALALQHENDRLRKLDSSYSVEIKRVYKLVLVHDIKLKELEDKELQKE